MLAPQYLLTKFQEFLEIELDSKPNKAEVLKKLRDFNRNFIANNYNIDKGIEYLQGQVQNTLQKIPIPTIIQEKLKIQDKTMQYMGYGLQGIYLAVMNGLNSKRGQFIAEGPSYSYLNSQLINNQIGNGQGLLHFQEIAIILLKNSINLQLKNHLLENGIQIGQNIDVQKLTIGQSAILIDNLKYVTNIDIQQIIYYKATINVHRLVLLSSSLVNCVKIILENEINSELLKVFLIFDDNNQKFDNQYQQQQNHEAYKSQQKQLSQDFQHFQPQQYLQDKIQQQPYQIPKTVTLQTHVKQVLEDMNKQTDFLIDNYQLKKLDDYSYLKSVEQFRNQILIDDKRKKCLKCQQEFQSDFGTVAGQITNFCIKCYKEFQI